MDLTSISSRMPRTTTVLFFLYINLLVNTGVATFTMPANVTVPAFIAFGDSMLDQGNNNYIPTFIRANFPPYGMSFLGAKATGRFTNAKTPVDLIAEKLLVKEYVPPYLDPFIDDEDMITGVSFASAATGFDPLTSTINMALPMVDQLQMFANYIRKLQVLVGKEGTENILNNSLFLVASGSDDFVLNYFSPYPMRKVQYDIPTYADFLVSKASSFVQGLHRLGARRVAVLSLPPIGCMPTSRTFGGGGENRSCSRLYNEAAEHTNEKLSAEFESLRSRDPPVKVIFADIYNPVMDMVHNPQSYGFEIVDRGCCGTGMVECSWMCNEFAHTCSDISKYLFWDSFHPTEKGYSIIVENVLERYVQNALQLWTR
uniref:GDSL esterase/lipase At1g59030-like n=1 Tax=Erigeron canadensis TaxID=72917 RepID=UPI001CB9B8BF|nr:GDSL esterase/lipase At1g59030-like [Erigeron canadensis]